MLTRADSKEHTMTETRPNLTSGDWSRHVRRGTAIIALVFGGAGLWSATAQLDSAVVAHGRVVAETDRQIVQHLEGGIVRALLVPNDNRVQAGQVLLRLDTTQARAQVEAARLGLASAAAAELRLSAEIAGDTSFMPQPDAGLTARVGAELMSRALGDQARLFADRLATAATERGILVERLRQIEQQVAGARAQLNATEQQLRSFSEELGRLAPLMANGTIPRLRLDQVERARTDATGRIGALQAEISRLELTRGETQLRLTALERTRMEDASARLAETRRLKGEADERLKIGEDQIARAEVRAPLKGRIVQTRVTTVGAVVRPGETLFEIVPDDDVLIVQARLNPMDIAFVHAGLAAEIKLPSFKARTTPIAIGEVLSVGADAVIDEATRQPYYELQVSVRVASFPAALRERLVPGMPAEILVPTGERTVLDYMIQPLTDALRRGMRES
jgi:HlyD family type I secretion membrane fusion protein